MLFLINYTKACIYSSIYYFHKSDILLDIIIHNIHNCGCIAIKFTQWLLPRLELIYDLNPTQDKWFKKLEEFYEYNHTHDISYTKQIYHQDFHKSFNDDYIFDSIIGSGSIGQVYKIKHKHTNQYYAMKINHPHINHQIIFLKYIILFIQYIPFINKQMNYYIPIDLYQFILDFKNQTNMILETNNCLRFYEYYKDNDLIIIPKIISFSKNIIIMSYEEGIRFDDLQVNNYMKFKCIQLLQIFIKNNQLITNFNHGDLHKGNWKIKLNHKSQPSLIIYDFGFCWDLPYQDKPMLFFIDETFHNLDNGKNCYDDLIKVCKFLLSNQCKSETIKQEIPPTKLYDISHNPELLFKSIISICKKEKIILDSILLQILIHMNIITKYLKQYGLMDLQGDLDTKFKHYEYFRRRLIDIYCLCKTHNIFHDYQSYIESKIDSLEINGLFETIGKEYDFSNIKQFLHPKKIIKSV